MKPPCPNAKKHTRQPEGYANWHLWAERKGETHRQVRCDGCGDFEVWDYGRNAYRVAVDLVAREECMKTQAENVVTELTHLVFETRRLLWCLIALNALVLLLAALWWAP